MTDIPTPEKLGHISTPAEIKRQNTMSWRVRAWMIADMKKGFLGWTINDLMPDFPRSYPYKHLYYGERLAVVEVLTEDFKQAGWNLRINRQVDEQGKLKGDSSVVLEPIETTKEDE